jgi:hypothetical protein
LPDELNNLVPEFMDSLPEDPFNGKPLLYRKLDKGYCVYSVGANGKDDGGTPKLDVAFTVRR